MKKLSILFLASMIALTACAHRDQYGNKKEANAVAEKTTAWTLVEWRTPDGKEALLPTRGALPLTLVFKPMGAHPYQTTFKGFAGCNDIQGLYTENSQTLSMTTHSSTTRICPAPVMKMEHAFIQSISNTPLQKGFRPSHSGRILVLSSREGDVWTFLQSPLSGKGSNRDKMSPITPR